jgi:acyl-CoA reductase-like NAD-dependent aldehyde dehydrogenase
VTLELGGKSPVVVLDDANFDHVVPLALQVGCTSRRRRSEASSNLVSAASMARSG